MLPDLDPETEGAAAILVRAMRLEIGARLFVDADHALLISADLAGEPIPVDLDVAMAAVLSGELQADGDCYVVRWWS